MDVNKSTTARIIKSTESKEFQTAPMLLKLSQWGASGAFLPTAPGVLTILYGKRESNLPNPNKRNNSGAPGSADPSALSPLNCSSVRQGEYWSLSGCQSVSLRPATSLCFRPASSRSARRANSRTKSTRAQQVRRTNLVYLFMFIYPLAFYPLAVLIFRQIEISQTKLTLSSP